MSALRPGAVDVLGPDRARMLASYRDRRGLEPVQQEG